MPEQDLSLVVIPDNLPVLSLTCEPSIAATGDLVKVLISTDADSLDEDLVLELVLAREPRNRITIGFEGKAAEFEVTSEFVEGEYSLQLRRDHWVLDSIPFEVTDRVYAKQAASFNKGLELRVKAMDAISEGNYAVAMNLGKEVEACYEAASCTDIAASSWKEIGSALLQAKDNQKSQEAFQRAYGLFNQINDAEGQAASLFMLGQAAQNEIDVENVLDIYDRARSIADSCDADLIGLRSREALWRLSSGSRSPLRRQYYRDLISNSCSVRSNRTRDEAIILFDHLAPISLLGSLWSFDATHVVHHKMRFECVFSTHAFASQRTELLPFRLHENIVSPWDRTLAVFTSALLSSLVLSISNFVHRTSDIDVELKVTTFRDREKECFYLGSARIDDEEFLREAVDKYVSFDNDFKYYKTLATSAGALLLIMKDGQDLITMEMPLIAESSED